MKAVLRKIRISPKKANLVAGMVRGKSVNEALQILEAMPKKGAKLLYKVVHSAASNAKENFKQSIDDLYITQILVTKGPTYKRSLPISRGRVHPIAKRTTHITVEVGILEASAEVSKKVEKKAQVETPEKKEPTPKAKVTKETPAKKATKKTTPKAKKESEKPKISSKK